MKDFYDAAIVTAASGEYFPWLLNLIGSIQKNYPGHPPVIAYLFDMRPSFMKEIASLNGVIVREVKPFVTHWRLCYTWKPWIFNDAPARNIYFIDAASEVLKPLVEIFHAIENDGYFCVNQKHAGRLAYLRCITPPDMLKRIGLPGDFCGERLYFAAGNFGYKKGTEYHECVKEALELAKEGWTLGWSAKEETRNKGHNRCAIVRDCEIFRHDQTLLNLLWQKRFSDFKMHDEDKYGAFESRNKHPEQVIWNSRRRNSDLPFVNHLIYRKKPVWPAALNRFLLFMGKY